MLAAEAAPLAKVGGLADVVGSLPKALQALGHDVRVVLPVVRQHWNRYNPVEVTRFRSTTWGARKPGSGRRRRRRPFLLVTGDPIPRSADLRAHDRGGRPKFVSSRSPRSSLRDARLEADVVHAHDSHTGAAVWWLGTEGRPLVSRRGVRLTIHNLPTPRRRGKALGDYKLRKSDALFALPAAYRDSLMALGILGADWLTTVSPTYAREILTPEGGHGLDGVLRARADRLAGILNGIDAESWNPATDADLAATYDATTLARRARNKTELQRESGLEPDARMPLLAVVRGWSRRRASTSPFPPSSAGSTAADSSSCSARGPALEHDYAQFELRYPHRASVRLRFDARYARRVYAGADALLVPSRYEPCGLAQMIAMRYGAVPVARRTGGLADTVTDAGDPSGAGTGLMFDEFNPWALWDALDRALKVYAQPAKWAELQKNGMGRDFSWSRSGREYATLYARAVAARSAG